MTDPIWQTKMQKYSRICMKIASWRVQRQKG